MKKEQNNKEFDFGVLCLVGFLLLMIAGVAYSVAGVQHIQSDLKIKEDLMCKKVRVDGFFYNDYGRAVECNKLEEHKGEIKVSYCYALSHKGTPFFDEIWIDNDEYYPYPNKEQLGKMYKQYCKDVEKAEESVWNKDGGLVLLTDGGIVKCENWESITNTWTTDSSDEEKSFTEDMTICGTVKITR
jgi:hypothetical protein